jgi:hypothetical protein
MNVQGPKDPQLQGRAGFLRVRANGRYDMGFMVLYLPGERIPDAHKFYVELLKWATEVINQLGKRCSIVTMMDANTKLGGEELNDEMGTRLIGTTGGQRDSRHGNDLRGWIATNHLQVANTLEAGSSGHTWRGNGEGSRIDYIMTSTTSVTIQRSQVCYREAQRLQLARVMRWMDHAPIKTWCRCRSWYDPNNDYIAAHLTIDEAGTLRRSEDLQQQLQEMVEEKCTFYRMDLDSMWENTMWKACGTTRMRSFNMPQMRFDLNCVKDGATEKIVNLNKLKMI